jgi:hypothetical protein
MVRHAAVRAEYAGLLDLGDARGRRAPCATRRSDEGRDMAGRGKLPSNACRCRLRSTPLRAP